MSMASVTVRVDADTKKQATSIVEDFGFDLSSVTRAFLRQIVREKRIPLNLSYPLPDDTVKALQEAEELSAKGEARFNTADEMFASLGI